MKKIFLGFLLLMSCFSFPVKSYEVSVSAKSAVVLEPITSRVLYEKNAHEKLGMASTTKIMTALITQEYIDKNGDILVEISDKMVNVEGSSMGLAVGDKVHLSALIVGMLLPSGNDAANSCAIAISGDLENFAILMNEKAKLFGMNETNFVTPSGLTAENHYSTAYDMALLMARCVQNQKIKSIMNCQNMMVNYYSNKEKSELTVTLYNHNKLLTSYEFCDGGKTGYTQNSGRTLVSSATKNDCSLVAVTLNAPDDWNDHEIMYENAFENTKQQLFERRNVNVLTSNGGFYNAEIEPVMINNLFENEIERSIFLPRFCYFDDIENGKIIGKVCYYIDKKLIYTSKIIKRT